MLPWLLTNILLPLLPFRHPSSSISPNLFENRISIPLLPFRHPSASISRYRSQKWRLSGQLRSIIQGSFRTGKLSLPRITITWFGRVRSRSWRITTPCGGPWWKYDSSSSRRSLHFAAHPSPRFSKSRRWLDFDDAPWGSGGEWLQRCRYWCK